MTNRYYRLPTGHVLALDSKTPFPPLEHALTEPNGLLAIGDKLSPERLVSAYQQGIFPWYSTGEPVLWWSPNPRMVLFPEELRVSKSLQKRLNKQDYEIRYDTSFREVINACSKTPRTDQNGTWIVDDLIEAYCDLHQRGYAHSVETWIDNQLAGGLYGITIGNMFYGESMFHYVTDASKIAFVHLVRHLKQQGVGMIDCQMKTSHLATFGAREISRENFLNKLTELIQAA